MNIEAAINRNADTICVTIFVIFDLLLSVLILKYSASYNPPLAQNIEPIQFHIDTYTFRAGIVIKSVILYLTAFAAARRLP